MDMLHGSGIRGAYRGSHHIFTLEGRRAALNFQPDGAKAKAYQVKQIRRIILDQGLTSHGEDQ